MNVQRNCEARSCNYFCSGRAIGITYFGYVCSLRYPACNANTLYCHLWPARLYWFFAHYLIKGTIFEKNLLNIKCVFWFPLQKSTNTKFSENPSTGSRVIPYRQTDRHTDMTKLIVAFGNYVNASKI